MLYPCCGTGPVPGLEGYQAQNSKGSWNWCTGVGDSGYPVLFACFCGSPHLWLVELGYAGLAVSLAADYFRLSLPERPFVFLIVGNSFQSAPDVPVTDRNFVCTSLFCAFLSA